jgi:hypothetical protein
MAVPQTVTFYTDGHIPFSVADQCRRKAPDIEIVRCEEIGLKDAPDDAHWEHILTHWRVLVTADRGFLKRAADRNRQGKDHPGIIFVAPHMQGKPCIGQLVDLIVFLHEAVKAGAATLENDVNNRVEIIR